MARLARPARFLSAFAGGTYAGFLLGVLVLEWSLRGFGPAVYTQVQQVKHLHLNVLAGVLLTALLATDLLLVALDWRIEPRNLPLDALGLACAAGALAVTLLVNVPVNAAQMTWTVAAPPPDWAAVRDRWQVAHALRTALASLGFAAQLIVIVALSPPRDAAPPRER